MVDDEENSFEKGEYWRHQKEKILGFIMGLGLGLGLNFLLKPKPREIEKPKEGITYDIPVIFYVAVIVTILALNLNTIHFTTSIAVHLELYWACAGVISFTYLFLFFTKFKRYWFYISFCLFIFASLIIGNIWTNLFLSGTTVQLTLSKNNFTFMNNFTECNSPVIYCQFPKNVFVERDSGDCRAMFQKVSSDKKCEAFVPPHQVLWVQQGVYDGYIPFSSFVFWEEFSNKNITPSVRYEPIRITSYEQLNNTSFPVYFQSHGDKTIVVQWLWTDANTYYNGGLPSSIPPTQVFYSNIAVLSGNDFVTKRTDSLISMIPVIFALFSIIPGVYYLRNLWNKYE